MLSSISGEKKQLPKQNKTKTLSIPHFIALNARRLITRRIVSGKPKMAAQDKNHEGQIATLYAARDA